MEVLRNVWRTARRQSLGFVLGAVLAVVACLVGLQPRVTVIVRPAEDGGVTGVGQAGGSDDYTPTFGWIRHDEAIQENLDPQKTLQFADTPAGQAVLSSQEDVFLWRAVRHAAGRSPTDQGWYPNVNQRDVGCCVGTGYKHGVDALLAVQRQVGLPEEWKPVSVEVIYAGSRVEVGGGRISGDGSVGAWAARWCRDWGVVSMEVHGRHDLREFLPRRAREWGRREVGVPDDLEPIAKRHPVRSTALVRTWADVERAVRQGYPVVVCSDQGFRMERDSTGRARPQGQWMHCMVVLGVRTQPAGAFILNSWGDQAHTGPRVPADMPPAGFWADAAVVHRMVGQGDSFALSDAVGFPKRKLDWYVIERPTAADLLARRFDFWKGIQVW